MVFKGSFQGRAVAVKRLLQDFVTLATREVSLLQESDDHPNVIRYFYKEAKENFLYIALELCPASLADIVERPHQFQDIAVDFDPKRALAQVTAGLRHLHSLKIVHRDIKPPNILVGLSKKSGGTGRNNATLRMLISDFGLCKKLDSDQTSFLPTAHSGTAAGTVGWRAPEILRGEVKLDEQTFADGSSGGLSLSNPPSTSGSSSNGFANPGNRTRLTKSVDVFALGCLFYYSLSSGDHPYGDRFEREINILKNAKSLGSLERLGEEGVEAVDLVTKMLDPEPQARYVVTMCLPIFSLSSSTC
jgi:serine/threonine-protein kinase/endoribonuclease IRE1